MEAFPFAPKPRQSEALCGFGPGFRGLFRVWNRISGWETWRASAIRNIGNKPTMMRSKEVGEDNV